MKVGKNGINLSFIDHQKKPSKSSTFINETNIISETFNRYSRRRTPNITMYDLSRFNKFNCRIGKRKFSKFTL
jgi:hypothetical protein